MPTLLVFMGLMGTGKSHLARLVGKRLGRPVINSDTTRKELAGIDPTTKVHVDFEAGLYGPEMSANVYAEMRRQAIEHLKNGQSVILDGSYKRLDEREAVWQVSQENGASVVFVEVTCEEAEVRRRLAQRVRGETESDGRLELLDRQRADFDSPAGPTARLTRQVDNSGDLFDVVTKIIDKLPYWAAENA
ncbi:MAG: AAA family ATPase [Proteobacteria bacterium]|nr:AAA family ATPase [Pseudomonadota bacterium]MBU1743187.1 AAA family ATPase [Pseudomonadota bacterium]